VNVSIEFKGARGAPGPQFRFVKIPSVTLVAPKSGKATEKTQVVIFGNNFDTTPGATKFGFGSNTTSDVLCLSAVQCIAIAQPGVGTVDVIATVNGIPGPVKGSFTYAAVVTAVSPNKGVESGGDKVTISGAGFVEGTVFFGPNQAQFLSCPAPTSCSAMTPGGSGAVDVHYDSWNHISGTTDNGGRFTYIAGNPKGWTQWHLNPPEAEPGDALSDDPLTREVLYMVPHQGDTATTYAWDRASQGWVRKNATTNPRPSKSAFAFDVATGKALLFGGLIDTVQDKGDGILKITYKTDNSTWLWDGTNWSIANSAINPPPRYRASIAYDAAHSKIVLFGGCRDYGCVDRLNDTWTWDGSNWKQESPSVSPSARNRAAMAYNQATSSIILFGGATTNGVVSDTWAWSGQNWSELQPAQPAPARYGSGLAYSPADSGLVLYGGRTYQGGQIVILDDTWIWNGSSWTQASTPASPKITTEIAGMIYDTALNAVVVIGDDAVWSWGGR
jgi:hypothetical protein